VDRFRTKIRWTFDFFIRLVLQLAHKLWDYYVTPYPFLLIAGTSYEASKWRQKECLRSVMRSFDKCEATDQSDLGLCFGLLLVFSVAPLLTKYKCRGKLSADMVWKSLWE